MTQKSIILEMFTRHMNEEFFDGQVYINEMGNVCLYLDDENFLVLTPVMAKRLAEALNQAGREALANLLTE